MKHPCVYVLQMIILFFYNTSYITANDLMDTDRYHKHIDEKRSYYEKYEPSGCNTTVILDKDADYFFVNHGIRCKTERKKRESLNEIADSVYDIFIYFNIINIVKSKKSIYVNIGWATNHEPLLLFINEDDQWPDNIYIYSVVNSGEEKRYDFYKDTVRKEILKSKIFSPLSATMKKINCRMQLKKDYVDGLFFNKNNLTKDMLIKLGVFRKEEAKKDEYPVLKGAIEFDLSCY